MDFTKVVNKRHSVRQFTDQAVETDLIKEIVTVAQRTPSWDNSQPWQSTAREEPSCNGLRKPTAKLTKLDRQVNLTSQ